MPIVAVFESPSLTREKYDEGVRQLTDGKGLDSLADWPVPGVIAHISSPTETGFRVIDVWESEEAFGRFGEMLLPIMQGIGVDVVPSVSEVHTLVTR